MPSLTKQTKLQVNGFGAWRVLQLAGTQVRVQLQWKVVKSFPPGPTAEADARRFQAELEARVIADAEAARRAEYRDAE